MALVAAFSGCTVATTVSVSEPSPGVGTVAVSVALDRSALAAVGGLAGLRSELSVGDLSAAGWTVTGPTATAAGGAVVMARHPFAHEADVGPLLSEVAGPGVYNVSLRRHRTFWHTYYRLSGGVDLRCGLDCFGDSGLRAATGSPVGVDPGPLAAAAGEQPSSVFRFSLQAALPGRIQSTNASARRGGTLGWTPVLGRALTLAASSSTLNEGAVVTVAGGGAGVVLVLVALVVVLFVRRRRRRRRRRRSQAGAGGAGETVTPSS